jgi:hypothetical protein
VETYGLSDGADERLSLAGALGAATEDVAVGILHD